MARKKRPADLANIAAGLVSLADLAPAAGGDLQGPEGIPAAGAPARDLGYLLSRGEVQGRGVLGPRQEGKELLIRLKDSAGSLAGEVAFWAGQVVGLLPALELDRVDWITPAPSSKKKPYHLATALARAAADLAGLPYAELFQNDAPRGHRALLAEKLTETLAIRYRLEPAGRVIVVIDDAIYTRSTAKALIQAAGGETIRFLWLYVA